MDLAQLVHGMEELLKRAVGLGIAFTSEYPEDLPPLLVDANQLELALLNVALNARDAKADGGSVNITARADRVPPAASAATRHPGNGFAKPTSSAADGPALRTGDYIRIIIVDTGVGMDQLTPAKATEPFFTTKGPGKGTGLGLSMVQGLAAQSGGLLRIHSEPNAGTVVELWFTQGHYRACFGGTSVRVDHSDQTRDGAVYGVDRR